MPPVMEASFFCLFRAVDKRHTAACRVEATYFDMDWDTFFETLDMAYYAHTFAVHLMQSSQQVGDQFKLDIAQRTEALVDKEGVNIETALVYRTQTQGQRQTAKETFATRQQVDWHLAVLLVEVCRVRSRVDSVGSVG